MQTRRKRCSTRGAALVETALVLTMLMVLMVNAINFGMYIYAWVTVNNAARALLEYRVYTGVVLGFPSSPTVTQMDNVVTAEVSSLPNKGSVTWNVCGNANGAVTCEKASPALTVTADPQQPTQYTLYSAKVSYTFQPLITGLTPAFNPVVRQLNMRSMQ